MRLTPRRAQPGLTRSHSGPTRPVEVDSIPCGVCGGYVVPHRCAVCGGAGRHPVYEVAPRRLAFLLRPLVRPRIKV